MCEGRRAHEGKRVCIVRTQPVRRTFPVSGTQPVGARTRPVGACACSQRARVMLPRQVPELVKSARVATLWKEIATIVFGAVWFGALSFDRLLRFEGARRCPSQHL